MTVDEFISDLSPTLQVLMQGIRAVIMDAHPMIVEKMRYKIPFYDYKGMLFYLNPKKEVVEMGFCNGAQLIDEDEVLSATDRKVIRHLVIRNLHDVRRLSTRAIIQQAILVREVKVRSKK
jgi:uncharacterized protein